MLYNRARYECRGKCAGTQPKRDCLAEHAEVFKTRGDDIRNRVRLVSIGVV